MVDGDRVYISASYGTGTAGLKLLPEGGFEEVWFNRHLGFQFSTPVFEDGHLHAIDGLSHRMGALIALDPDTGEELVRTDTDFEERVQSSTGDEVERSFSLGEGSLLAVGDRFLALGDYGHLVLLDLTPRGAAVLERTWLFGASETWTPPVLSHGLLYVCQNNPERFGEAPARLLCYDLRAASE